jgi:hypothetical protein
VRQKVDERAMSNPVPSSKDHALVFVLARAIAIHRGDREPMAADRRLAAQLLSSAGAPFTNDR